MKLSGLQLSFYLTLLALFFTLILFEFSPLDLMIQDLFFNSSTQSWLIDRHQTLLKFVLYDGIKIVYVLLVFVLICVLIFFRSHKKIALYRQGLIIVLFSTICIPLFVSSLKAITNTPCPKNIIQYSGAHPYVRVFDKFPKGDKPEKNFRCFPAGHASGGFALMSLFFLFKTPRAKKVVLSTAILLGWVTGTYKMLIGDHFLSHTLVTMEIAWLFIIFFHNILNPRLDKI